MNLWAVLPRAERHQVNLPADLILRQEAVSLIHHQDQEEIDLFPLGVLLIGMHLNSCYNTEVTS